MAVRQPQVTMQVPLAAQTTQVTLSPTELCHYITDDELKGLSEMQTDPVKDISLASVGGFFGALVPAFDGLRRFHDATHPMTITDFLSVIVAVATFAVAVVTGLLWYRKSGAKDGAVKAIRERPKVQLVRT